MQRQLDVMEDELKQVENKMAREEMDPSSVGDYRVQFFEAST